MDKCMSKCTVFHIYSAPVAEWSIAISFSVCLCVYLSVCEHISGTAGPIFAKFFVQIPCDRGSILLWRCCNAL